MGHHIWPVGQAVKTPPFHGGIGGSIPPPVTKLRALSSAGRASALQAECQRFDPVSAHHVNSALHVNGVLFFVICLIYYQSVGSCILCRLLYKQKQDVQAEADACTSCFALDGSDSLQESLISVFGFAEARLSSLVLSV